MKYASVMIVMLSCLLLVGTMVIISQDDPVDDATCAAALEDFYITASEACIGEPNGMICNGGLPPTVTPETIALAEVGAMAELNSIGGLQSGAFSVEGHTGGAIWLRADETPMSALLLGEVRVEDVTPPDFPSWSSLIVETSEDPPACEVAPRNAFIAQGRERQQVNMVINGVSLRINGTVMVQTRGVDSIFVALDGSIQVISLGQSQDMFTGQQIIVPHDEEDFTRPTAAPSLPRPFDPDLVAHFPFALLDRPALSPQPGFVSTQGTVNLRTAPDITAPLLLEVPPGEIITVLGQNTAGDWFHVRLISGYTGWMFADLLRRQLGTVQAIYDNTPAPPQRFGRVGSVARVRVEGAVLQSEPYPIYPILHALTMNQEVTLLSRSPYNAWVQVDADGNVGWVPLEALDTRAIVASLVVDYSVPLPPEPTLVPGTYGNAFPDPSCFPDC